MRSTRKNAGETRGRPFEPGNPGRPQGARNKVTRAIEDLLDGEAEALTRKAIDMALGGDTTAMRLCLERLCPSRKDRHIIARVPPIKTPADVVKAAAAVLRVVVTGEITPSEGQALAGLIETQRRTLETEDHERRLAALEANIRSER